MGLPPGTPIHIGDIKIDKPTIQLIQYNNEFYDEYSPDSVAECIRLLNEDTVNWININGIHDIELIKNLGGNFKLHPLLLEDIVNTEHRIMLDDYGNHIFVIIKFIRFDNKTNHIMTDQINIVLLKNIVITLHENPDLDVSNTIRERIINKKGIITYKGADYLAYCLIDIIVDNYYIILENIEDKIDELDEELIEAATDKTLESIHNLKKNLSTLLKILRPFKDIISNLERTPSSLLDESLKIYLKDIADHLIYIIDELEADREILIGLTNIYLTKTSNKMSEVMKVLTMITSVFIPLTFLAGIYGMNFKFMPERDWLYGYPVLLGLMLIVVIGMIFYFKKKKWL